MKGKAAKHGCFGMAIIMVILSFACRGQGPVPPSSTAPLESCLETELLRLAETYRFLDLFGEELWPGWKNYVVIPVKVNFPDGVVLFVGTLSGDKSGFERVAGRTVSGKAVYVNRQNRTSVEVRPPLFAQMAHSAEIIELNMEQPDLPALEGERSAALEAALKEVSRPESPFNLAPHGDSDAHVLTYAHEHFHGHQLPFRNRNVNAAALRDVKVDAAYAAWSHIEGLALRRAYVESPEAEAREFLKDFVVAREIRRAGMPPEAVAAEIYVSLNEGTASYISLKAAMLLRDSDGKPVIDRTQDPFFYNYAYVGGYIDNIMRKGMDFAVSLTEDKWNKYYLYGAYQCFLLDRFAPGWKRGFLEGKKNLDSEMAGLLGLTSGEKDEIRKRLPARYEYDKIFSFHENALKKKSGLR